MSLYFKERIEEEQSEDPKKEMINFCRSWTVSIPSDPPVTFQISRTLMTTSDINSAKWKIGLTKNFVNVEPEHLFPINIWCGDCYLTYKLYSGSDLRSELYSSERISLTEEQNAFVTPVGAMKEFRKYLTKRKVAKMIIFVELELPKIFFLLRAGFESLKCCEKYPENMDSDFRFEFLKDGDFTFKCHDGYVPALKMVMNVTSLKKYLNETNNDELVIDHDVDVVEPIITYFHSQCFEMPTTYNLDFADRFIKAVKFFQFEDEELRKIGKTVYFSFCVKFVKEPHDFELILEWASFVSRHSIPLLYIMVSTTIAHKYYHQFLERFPESTVFAENQLFGKIFRDATNIYGESLFSKAILFVCDDDDDNDD